MEVVLTQSIFFRYKVCGDHFKKINFLGLESSVFEKYTVCLLGGIEGTSLGTQTESVVYSKLTKAN